MRKILLLMLAFPLAGCAASPHAGPNSTCNASRWQVIPLNSGGETNGNVAILLDSQTGDTWMNTTGTNSWAKMNR